MVGAVGLVVALVSLAAWPGAARPNPLIVVEAEYGNFRIYGSLEESRDLREHHIGCQKHDWSPFHVTSTRSFCHLDCESRVRAVHTDAVSIHAGLRCGFDSPCLPAICRDLELLVRVLHRDLQLGRSCPRASATLGVNRKRDLITCSHLERCVDHAIQTLKRFDSFRHPLRAPCV